MKEDQFNDDSLETRLDENDPVWRLLGESPRPEPDAWFAVRTVARCKYAVPGEEAGRFSFFGIWRWLMGTGLGFGLAIVLVVTQVLPIAPAPDKQKNVQEAFEIMASINSTSTPDSDSSSTSPTWQDSSL